MALMGAAQGALQGVQTWLNAQIQQQREDRLAAIRAQERGEDRAFQRETMQMQADQRQAERGEDREFQTTMREGDREFQRQTLEMQQRQQLELADKSRDTQLAVAGTYRQPQESAPLRYLVNRNGNEVEVAGNERQPGDVTMGAITASGGFVPIRRSQPGSQSSGGRDRPLMGESTSRPGGVMADESTGGGVEKPVWDQKLGRFVLPSQQ